MSLLMCADIDFKFYSLHIDEYDFNIKWGLIFLAEFGLYQYFSLQAHIKILF